MRKRIYYLPLKALILTGAGLLLWASFRLGRYLMHQMPAAFLPGRSAAETMAAVVFTLVCGWLSVTLFLLACSLPCYLFGWPPPFPNLYPARAAYVQTRRLLQLHGHPLQQAYIVIVALLGTFYAVFLQESPMLILSWNILLPCLFLASMHNRGKTTFHPALIIFPLLLLISLLRMVFRDFTELLAPGAALLPAAVLSFFVMGIVVVRAVHRPQEGLKLWQWRLVLWLFSASFAALLYFMPVIQAVNCYTDNASPVSCKAVIFGKCPPGARYDLQVSITYAGNTRGHLLGVDKEEYYRFRTGDTLTLNIYPGYLGWPWFNTIKKQQ